MTRRMSYGEKAKEILEKLETSPSSSDADADANVLGLMAVAYAVLDLRSEVARLANETRTGGGR